MSLLLASSRRCDGGDMTAADFPPGSTDGQVWLWDASAGEWALRVLTAADVGALADNYAPTWGDVTGKPSTYPPSSHSHSYASLSSKPFTYSTFWNWSQYNRQTIYTFSSTDPRSTTLFLGHIKVDSTLDHYGFTVYATWDGSNKVTVNTAAISSGYSISTELFDTRVTLNKPNSLATTLRVAMLQFYQP
jgi:hypothetical protein